jgi:tetratricopeptide (TPR) repeat protein
VDTDAGKDFFISYTSADTKWAEWIAWQLEEAQYSTILQAWDFQPGMNFVLEMDQAATVARCTIVVLSPEYLSARYTQPEWTEAFRRDPKSEKGALLPVRVQKCEVEGLLGSVIYIDLVNLDEVRAHETLLAGVRRERGKPKTAPGFPGAREHTLPEPRRFPGHLPPLWNIPYRRNPFFTGREDILERLAAVLRTGNTAALTQPQTISGLGGIGKTQSAVEYTYRYANDYQAVLWVTAATRDTLILSFLDLARLLNLPEKDVQDQTITVQAVKQWLEQHDDWLLIVDNADDLALAEEFLPTAGTGHILLTTRAQAPGSFAEGMNVEQMDTQEGMLLLLRRAKVLAKEAPLSQAHETDRAAAERIVQALDGLPLALDQAGAYIEETQCSVSAYLASYQQRQAELLQLRGGTGKEHPEPVATTWSLSFEQVERFNPMATDLLRVCAFLAPDAIPEDLLLEGASELGARIQPLGTDATRLNDAIGVLLRYSFVKRDPHDRTFSVHRLVQEVLKESMKKRTQRTWAERVVKAVNLAFPDSNDVSLWEHCERLLPHALVCARLIEEDGFEFDEAARLLNQTARYLYRRAQYPQAEPLYQRALAIRVQQLGPEHPDTATSLNGLAGLYYKQGKYEQAEPLFKRALAIREQQLGSEHPDTAQSLNDLALLYYRQGKYEQAEPLYQRALAIVEQQLGSEHPETATVRENYNNFVRDMKRKGKGQR